MRMRFCASVLATHRSPVTGLRSIASSVVPTPEVTEPTTVSSVVSTAMTSRSGS